MPRNGSNVYSKPAGTTAVSGQVIESSKFNEVIDDLVVDANNPRPVEVGGTGASSASGARTALGVVGVSDVQTLTNKTFGDGVAVESAAPYVDLYETDGTSAYATVRLINSSDAFKIQTRDSSSTFITDDYFIARDGSGATAHRWLIAGSEVVRVDSNGRVGIGEASPGASLHITSNDPIIRIEDSDTGAYHHLSGNSGGGNFFIDFDTGNYAAGAQCHIRRAGSTIVDFNDNGLRIKESGSRVNIIRDEDDMSSDDPNALATQQSIKAYADENRGYKWMSQVTSNGQTFIDFTGIPSWVTELIIVQEGFSWSGNLGTLIRIGDGGGLETSGYRSVSGTIDGPSTTTATVNGTGGFLGWSGNLQANTWRLYKSFSDNCWVCEMVGLRNTDDTHNGAGAKTLSGTLDRVRVTSTNLTATKSAGRVNVGYR